MRRFLGIFGIIMILAFAQLVSANNLVLDGITYDPAIISAGDEVDIVIQFHDAISLNPDIDLNQDPNYKLIVTLEADDTLTEEHVIILDAEGDSLLGHLYPNQNYNVKYRVKFMNDAPAANYEFKLTGKYVYDGEVQATSRFIRFMVPVKKEGIILGISNIVTAPAEIRSGDDYVRIDAYLENVGEKSAKAVEIDLDLPSGISSSYSDDNHVWIGRLNDGESKAISFFLDVDDSLEPGVYDLEYDIKYLDLDNNEYRNTLNSRLLVKERPYLVIDSYEGSGLAASNGELKLYITNNGTTSAESVDVRLIKQSSQPFNFDVRSKYLGELEAGETGEVIFDLDVHRDADITTHSFKVVIRAKGDTDAGDDRIYIFDREAKFDVTGQAPNYFKTVGFIFLALVILLIIFKLSTRKRGKRK